MGRKSETPPCSGVSRNSCGGWFRGQSNAGIDEAQLLLRLPIDFHAENCTTLQPVSCDLDWGEPA